MKSILSIVLLASLALVPVSGVLADNNENNNNEVQTVTSENNTNMERNREGDSGSSSQDFSSSSDKNIESEDSSSTEPTNSDNKIESDESSSTDSLNKGNVEQNKERENNRYGDKFKMEAASTTEKLLNLTNKLGTVGTEIKAIVDEQASSSDAIASAVSKVEQRSALKTFFLGSDYKNLGQLVSEVAKAQNRLNQMENQVSKIASSTDKTAVLANIQSLKNQVSTLETFVNDNANKFSLFGWFVKMFNR